MYVHPPCLEISLPISAVFFSVHPRCSDLRRAFLGHFDFDPVQVDPGLCSGTVCRHRPRLSVSEGLAFGSQGLRLYVSVASG